MRWKSSEDEKPAWNRAKVPIGAAGRALPSQRSMPEINENPHETINISKKL